MKIKALFISLLLTVINTNVVFAQYSDLTGKYSFGANIELGKKWEFELSNEFRLNSNSTRLDKNITDLSVQYKSSKILSYELGLRYLLNKTEFNLWENKVRLNFDFNIKKNFGRFSILSKTRAQVFLNYEGLEDRAKSDDALFREKLSFQYNLKNSKFTPFFSGEIFIEDIKDVRKSPAFSFKSNAIRFEVGTKYKINKHNILSGYLGYENELNQVINQRVSIIGLNYKYLIKSK